jgi:uncharacterized membrane protein YbjE (DUF340 family)
MWRSLAMLGFFAAGIAAARSRFAIRPSDLALDGALYAVVFVAALAVGADGRWTRVLWRLKLRVLLVPLAIAAGTLGAAVIVAMAFGEPLRPMLAASSSFGFGSLSSVMIASAGFQEYAVVSLLAALVRESGTMMLAPALRRWLGPLAPIASGGATAMDTTLPAITRSSGNPYAGVAILSGIILSLLAPVLIKAIL